MMTKEQPIAHWLESSIDDFETMLALFNTGRYTHSLFFGHLYLEKICKALWIKNNIGNIPPFIHNLVKLVDGIDLGLSDIDLKFLIELNKYQLSGRYLEYTHDLQKRTNREFAINYIEHINNIYECLRKKI